MKIRRINFFGRPSAGKSTSCAGLFYKLKMEGYNIEQVQEYVKIWAFLNRKIEKYDQIYFLAKQIQKEQIALNNGCDYIVSDSPVFLTAVYAKYYGLPYVEGLNTIIEHYEQDYPSINIYLKPISEYNPVGRYQSAKEAEHVDTVIREYLDTTGLEYLVFDKSDIDSIFEGIKGYLE